MRMRFRVLISSILFLFVLGIFALSNGHAIAQTNDALRVIPLSQSGYEEAYSLTYSDDGKYLAVGGLSGIYLFDAQKLSLLDYLNTQALARSMLFLPNSHMLAAGLFDNTIKLWHVPDNQLTNTLSGPQGWIRGISNSKDGSLLASASDDNTVRVWKMPVGELILTIDQNTQGVRGVAISPNGKLVAGALEDNTVRVWRVADGSLLYTLSGHTDWVRCLAFSPDGSLLASGSFDMAVRLWHMSDGSLARTFKGHSSSILKLAFSPDGNMLASSAVDETVRLWHISDGNLIHVFHGYTGFIYALGFSPDGKTIASSGGNNQLLLWNLDALGINSATSTGEPAPQADVQSTSSDCRLCHHPQGQARPARVVYLSCETCHTKGTGLSFCIAFPRSPNAIAPIGYRSVIGESGLPLIDNKIAVIISNPSNGETMYVHGDTTAPEFITGKVYSADSESLEKIDLRLDIFSGSQKTASVNLHPSRTGEFIFNVAINSNAAPPVFSKPGTKICQECHSEFIPKADLPSGTVQIRVTASTPDGHQASDERWIRVDSSGEASVPVQVLDSLTNKPIPGLSINASTVLYNWRARYGTAISDKDGFAALDLEALSQATTSYQLSIPPQVVGGVLYTSQPTQVDLPPGATSHAAVTLTASAQNGQINGKLTSADSTLPAGLHVKAIQLPTGPIYETALSAQNTFVFDPIPVSQYLIVTELPTLIQQGLSISGSTVNLINSPNADVSLNVVKGRSLTGKITGKNGNPIPFAFARVNDQGDAYFADPTSGKILLTNLMQDADFVTVTAPGYYSQSQHVETDQKTLAIQLVPESENRSIPWGNGQIILPPETDADIGTLNINLNSGWLWGQNNDSQPLTIHAAGAEIQIASGEFALENAAGQTSWLYLYQGQAQIQFNGGQVPVKVRGGEMIALSQSADPIPFDSSVALALHPSLPESPVPENVQPTLGARMANWLEKIGIGAAQTITFITYILSLASLFAIPLFVLFWIKKRRKTTDSQE